MAQLVGQLTAQLALAVAAILLGIEDLGLADQGVDLLLQPGASARGSWLCA